MIDGEISDLVEYSSINGTLALQRPAALRPIRERVFLFLQGPASPFCKRLGRALEKAGARIVKVNICGGDIAFWLDGLSFRGGVDEWPSFVENVVNSRRVTDLVLFGDCRPHHAHAVAYGRRVGLTLHLFEEGYVRPGWVTMECWGVNDHSDMPREPEQLKAAACFYGHAPDVEIARDKFVNRAVWDVAWVASMLALKPFFLGYRHHAIVHPIVEYVSWIRRAAIAPLIWSRNRRAIDRLRGAPAPYYLFPMQLEGDYQIRVHSDYASIAEVARDVMKSFARTAPTDSLLVFKRHPLDLSFRNTRQMIDRMAVQEGIARRVVFVEKGDIGPLVAGSAGVVLVNSTSAMIALDHGKPLKVLGRAQYNIPGLAFQGPMDDFWYAGSPPDPVLWKAYLTVVIARTQINGGFFSRRGIEMAVAGCLRRILRGGIVPLTASWGSQRVECGLDAAP